MLSLRSIWLEADMRWLGDDYDSREIFETEVSQDDARSRTLLKLSDSRETES